MANLTEYLSITEAAELQGVTRQAIWALIERGRLSAVRVGHQWLISKSDLRKFKRQSPGPRAKK
jgi:excisionase family DNA binding protein